MKDFLISVLLVAACAALVVYSVYEVLNTELVPVDDYITESVRAQCNTECYPYPVNMRLEDGDWHCDCLVKRH